MIFAAGLGTRLRPLTDKTPKALIEIGGKPILWHIMKWYSRFGINEVVVNVHHLAEQITDYIKSQNDFGIKVDISDESYLLRDTGGGISYARDFLEGSSFLVHNVDIISDLNLNWFISQARPDALSSILVSERKTQRYLLFDDEMRMVGWTNLATGEVKTPFYGLNLSKCRKYAFDGIHFISDGIFKVFDDHGWNGKFSIMDFYIRECKANVIHGIIPEHLNILDVGKMETLPKAEAMIKNITHINI